MNKIIDYIWWVAVVKLIPLDAASILYYVQEETFNTSFWCVTIAFVLLSCVVGVRLCNAENRKDK